MFPQLQLHLNGSVEVTLPDFTKLHIPIERLTRLNDGLEQLEDLWGDELSEGHSDYGSDRDGEATYEIQAEDGNWQQYSGEPEDEWVDEDGEAMSIVGIEAEPNGVDEILEDPAAGVNDIVPGAWPSAEKADGDLTPQASTTPIPEPERSPLPVTNEAAIGLELEEPSVGASIPSWKRFDILASAPQDHAFLTALTVQTSRQFLSRLQKEYRALSSSLPGNGNLLSYFNQSLW